MVNYANETMRLKFEKPYDTKTNVWVLVFEYEKSLMTHMHRGANQPQNTYFATK